MLKDLLNWGPKRDLIDLIAPRKTFSDVILPEKTRRALADTLIQIEKHHLIFGAWGLGERHSTGTGLVFNFAGPPGTGKTICAEAVANLLGKRLYRVRYSELESCWAGETGKNITSVFRDARQQDAVLFFDEADSIASRRFTAMSFGYEREANQAVNILLKELESYDGVVIFATNLCANFDPAFERRVRTHIMFEMPGPRERELIWKVQIHPQKTPLADDVDFHALAQQFAVSGGDIKNAVLKAAQMAAAEEGLDSRKRIGQRHFVAAIQDVLAAKKVMDQNLFGNDAPACDSTNDGAARMMLAALETMETRLKDVEEDSKKVAPQIATVREETQRSIREMGVRVDALRQEMREETHTVAEELGLRVGALQEGMETGYKRIDERITDLTSEWAAMLNRATLIRLPRWATALLALAAAAGGYLLGVR